MVCFLKNIGFLLIFAGVALLAFYTIQNRVENIHFVIAGAMIVLGLISFIITNRFLNDKNHPC